MTTYTIRAIEPSIIAQCKARGLPTRWTQRAPDIRSAWDAFCTRMYGRITLEPTRYDICLSTIRG